MKFKIFMLFFICACISLMFFCSAGFSMELKSGEFKDGEVMPVRFTGFGYNISPMLFWKSAPLDTKSFALIMEDPDTPGGNWVHWVVYDVPNTLSYLKERLPKRGVMYNNIRQGKNSFGTLGYGGPYPPPGPAHRYVFTLYALDKTLNLFPGATKDQLMAAMAGHVLDTARLTGKFARGRIE